MFFYGSCLFCGSWHNDFFLSGTGVFLGFMGEIAFLMPNNFAVVYLFVILVMKLK